tara:strand:- start:517 stop:858 length:342 start_codon:yes stop_codon:yes gene_type:complete
MQRNIALSAEAEDDLDSINKGAELLLRRPPPRPQLQTKWRLKMEQAIIVLSIMVGVLTLGLGAVVGYLVRAYLQDTTIQYSHPEMFDANGNPLPDELLAIRFEGRLNETDDDD